MPNERAVEVETQQVNALEVLKLCDKRAYLLCKCIGDIYRTEFESLERRRIVDLSDSDVIYICAIWKQGMYFNPVDPWGQECEQVGI